MATLPRNQCCQSQKIKTCRVPSEVARCHSPPYMLPSAWKQVNFDVRGARGVCPGCCAMPPVLLMSLHRLWLSRFNLACLPQNRTGFLAAFAAVLPMVSRWNFTAARPYFWVCGRTNGYPDLYPQCIWYMQIWLVVIDLPPGWLQADKKTAHEVQVYHRRVGLGREGDRWRSGDFWGYRAPFRWLMIWIYRTSEKGGCIRFLVPSFQTIRAPVPEVLVLAFTTWGYRQKRGCNRMVQIGWTDDPTGFPNHRLIVKKSVLVGNGWSFEMPKLVSSIGSCVSCMCQLWFWHQFQES